MNDIDMNFYCSANLYDVHLMSCNRPKCVEIVSFTGDICKTCACRHRKHPTPEQFKDEYGEEYPGNGAVWLNAWCPDDMGINNGEEISMYCSGEYHLLRLRDVKSELDGLRSDSRIAVICACTPYGRPPNDWRPENK